MAERGAGGGGAVAISEWARLRLGNLYAAAAGCGCTSGEGTCGRVEADDLRSSGHFGPEGEVEGEEEDPGGEVEEGEDGRASPATATAAGDDAEVSDDVDGAAATLTAECAAASSTDAPDGPADWDDGVGAAEGAAEAAAAAAAAARRGFIPPGRVGDPPPHTVGCRLPLWLSGVLGVLVTHYCRGVINNKHTCSTNTSTGSRGVAGSSCFSGKREVG